ncbi:MAG: hypothetical protein ACI9TV_000282 [Sulfurimonas sp.]|jgi:hypothetical protein|uniref:hypothetical protein n=1 Tax=Sulfurimonas sp. TaxID=2022749 RepID=UPI0039E638CD
MNQFFIFFTISILFLACADNSSVNSTDKISYLQNLENDNNISYDKIINTRASYITSMCYTKTEDNVTGAISNPCYSCHTVGKIPNYYNDTNLQLEYNFPHEIMKNPYINLFKDRSVEVQKISDESILEYVRESNYIDTNGTIILADKLPESWKGYKPDCYFNFDDEGFDKDNNNEYTLWRAFRYYPFLGTFWPTNGSTDDVMIRLAKVFSQDDKGSFDLEVYKLNLKIVESLIKNKDVNLPTAIDEVLYGVDLNQNGTLDSSTQIIITTYDKMSYVGKAKEFLEKGNVHLALGLFPVGTEFLHSVRYLDWDNTKNHIKMSQRMKELRYAKKYTWKTYSEIKRIASSELQEALALDNSKAVMATFRGSYEEGLNNDIGWIYQGFIEDKQGSLRPQTHEETINCMGCHSHLGTTTDSVFAYPRMLDGIDKNAHNYAWNHWSQKGIVGLKEPTVKYKNHASQYEYSFYLQNNHSANEFRNNDEVQEKFFAKDGKLKQEMIDQLHNDISILLFPSYERTLTLNKAYKTLVEEQSFIYGRNVSSTPMPNVFQEVREGQMTNISSAILRGN